MRASATGARRDRTPRAATRRPHDELRAVACASLGSSESTSAIRESPKAGHPERPLLQDPRFPGRRPRRQAKDRCVAGDRVRPRGGADRPRASADPSPGKGVARHRRGHVGTRLLPDTCGHRPRERLQLWIRQEQHCGSRVAEQVSQVADPGATRSTNCPFIPRVRGAAGWRDDRRRAATACGCQPAHKGSRPSEATRSETVGTQHSGVAEPERVGSGEAAVAAYVLVHSVGDERRAEADLQPDERAAEGRYPPFNWPTMWIVRPQATLRG